MVVKKMLYEAIKIIESYDMNFNLGNVIKYTLRAGKKLDGVEDLTKSCLVLKQGDRQTNQIKYNLQIVITPL